MRLKIQCTNPVPNASIWQYSVGDTLCRQNRAEIDFWQTGWLARKQGSEKHPSEGSRRGARARHSLRKPVAPRLKNGALLKRQILKMIIDLWQPRKRLSGRKCCSQREPNAKPSLFADLEPSEPDDRPVDQPVDRPTLLMFDILKTLWFQ
jgi:hypothetical protein